MALAPEEPPAGARPGVSRELKLGREPSECREASDGGLAHGPEVAAPRCPSASVDNRDCGGIIEQRSGVAEWAATGSSDQEVPGSRDCGASATASGRGPNGHRVAGSVNGAPPDESSGRDP